MIVIIIKGLIVKRSRQKELILRVLQRNPSHPPAVWIYDEVRKEMPHVSLATVYRNLRLFREQGEISELKLDGSLSRFELRQVITAMSGVKSATESLMSLSRQTGISKAGWLRKRASSFQITGPSCAEYAGSAG